MPTPEELFEKLEERLIMGEITEETYKELKSKLLSKSSSGSTDAKGTDKASKVGDIVMGRAATMNIDQSQKNYFKEDLTQKRQATRLGEHCPICKAIVRDDYFYCEECRRNYIHIKHQDPDTYLCLECVTKNNEKKKKENIEKLLKESQILKEQNKFDEAIIKYREVLIISENIDAENGIKFCEEELTKKAEEEKRKYIQSLLDEANDLMYNEQYKDAIDLYNKILNVSDDAIDEVKNGIKNCEEGLRKKAEEDKKEKIQNILSQADELIDSGEFENAIEKYDLILSISDDEEANEGKLKCEERLRLQAEEEGRIYIQSLLNKGSELINTEQYKEAIGLFDDILKVSDNDDAQNGITFCEERIRIIKEKEEKEKLHLLVSEGTRLLNNKEYIEAIDKFNEVLKKENNVDAQKGIEYCNAELKRIEIEEKQRKEDFLKEQEQKRIKKLDNLVGKLILVQGGSFQMGDASGSGAQPIHKVELSSFEMGEALVTFEQFDVYCNETGEPRPSDEGWGRGNRPVINITWEEAVSFCSWLSGKAKKIFRLPTEAEWEYAARGGNKSKNYRYGGSNTIDEVGWCGKEQTYPIKSKKTNELGLYDISGNVWEWCYDNHDKDYYYNSPKNNPKGPGKGWNKVIRGGAWNSIVHNCKTTHRSRNHPEMRSNTVGFRLVCESK